jgi:FkbM family methyltransferase
MLIDCFMFFNELDIVESRLEYLYNRVDKFVIVEANITHSGKDKPFNFEENLSRYSKYSDKIVYHKAILNPSDYDFTRVVTKDDPSNPSWQVENAQRNKILEVLNQFPNNAFVMISDADEIPNKSTIDAAIKSISFNQPAVAFAQDFFIYSLNQKLEDLWSGTVLTTNSFVKKQTPQWFRTNRSSFTAVKNGGWHISYVGSAEAIQYKIDSFAHQELNTDKFKDLNYIQSRMQAGQDLYGRPYNVVPVNPNTFPKDFKNCFSKYISDNNHKPKGNTIPDNCQFGCGIMLADNYLNIDFLDFMFGKELPTEVLFNVPDKGNNCYYMKYDASKGVPILKDGQFKTVYHSHFLEHINNVDGYNFLTECYRILESGGVMRILVPDLELWADAYLNKKQDFLDWYRNTWLGDSVLYKTNAQIFMGALHNHEHKIGYDFETLKHILESIGFRNVVRSKYGESNIPSIEFLEDDNPRKYESLCVECTKPSFEKLNFIQVGAGAGDLDPRMNNRDGFTEYVKSLDPTTINKIVLVEPNPINIPKLKECWRDYPQAEILNIGICTSTADRRRITFYYADKDAPHYQVFSMIPEFVQAQYPNEPLRTVEVDCITIQELIDRTLGNQSIETLALDIEGIDAAIIEDTNWKNINCNFLSFEQIHLGDKRSAVVDLLENFGFSFVGNGLDHNGYDWMFRKNI